MTHVTEGIVEGTRKSITEVMKTCHVPILGEDPCSKKLCQLKSAMKKSLA